MTSNVPVDPSPSTFPLVVSAAAAWLLGAGTEAPYWNPEKVLMIGHCSQMVKFWL